MVRCAAPLVTAATARAPRTTHPHASPYLPTNASRITPTTANEVTAAARLAACGVAIAAHSIDSSTPATAIIIKKGARHSAGRHPKTHTAARAAQARTRPEAARTAKLFQSKGLARGKNVIDGDTAISSLARMEFGDRGFQMLGSIVGPIDILENQFGIGALPQKKIGDALLAARADDQVGGWRWRCGQVALKQALVKLGDSGLAARHRLGKAARRVDDVGPAAIVERHLKVKSIIRGGARLGALDDVQDVGSEAQAPADDPHPDAFAFQPRQIAIKIGLEQAHQFG